MVVAAPTHIPARHTDHPTHPLLYGFAITLGAITGILTGGALTTMLWVILPPIIGSVGTAALCIVGGSGLLASLLWKWAR